MLLWYYQTVLREASRADDLRRYLDGATLLSELHRRVATVALRAARRYGFALGGRAEPRDCTDTAAALRQYSVAEAIGFARRLAGLNRTRRARADLVT
jgi:hypothetical protein